MPHPGGQRAVAEPVAALRQAAAPAHPGECPLHHPAVVEDREPFDVLLFSDGPDDVGQTRSVRAFARLRLGVAAVGPEFAHVRGRHRRLRDDIRRAVPVPDAGRMHHDGDRRSPTSAATARFRPFTFPPAS